MDELTDNEEFMTVLMNRLNETKWQRFRRKSRALWRRLRGLPPDPDVLWYNLQPIVQTLYPYNELAKGITKLKEDKPK